MLDSKNMEMSFKKKIMNPASIQKIVTISLLSFILAVLLNAFYCNNSSPSVPSCAICKVKASTSGTFSKYNIMPFNAMDVKIRAVAIFLLFLGILKSYKLIVIETRITIPFSNKAPPTK
jgi:hypothetical protein